MDLLINEIFLSLQGETITTGLPSLFIRLTGCNLNCKYCDTPDAKTRGMRVPINTIVHIINDYQEIDHVTITGGEPLIQNNVFQLFREIENLGSQAQIETNGSLSLKDIPKGIRKIVDIKTPSSGEENSFFMENLKFLTEQDEIKFVIKDRKDYDFSRDFISRHVDIPCLINFSPVYGEMPFSELAEFILNDRLRVRFNIQLHKVIWQDEDESKKAIDSTQYR